MFDTVIVGGQVVSEGGVGPATIGIRDGKIAAVVAADVPLEARERIDAAGKLVFPGLVDPHVHFQTEGPIRFPEEFGDASIAAAHGGVTTFIPYIWSEPGGRIGPNLERYLRVGAERSVVDFVLHSGLWPDPAVIEQVPDGFALGITSFKMMMAYRATGRLAYDDHLLQAMDLIAERGGILIVHAESGLVIDYLERRFQRQGKVAPEFYLRSHPNVTEHEAIHRLTLLAELIGCELYVPHITSKDGVREVLAARARGQRVHAETCPHYLALTNQDVIDQAGFAKIGPPIRDEAELHALWAAIRDGTLDTIGSDHAPWTLADKRSAEGSIFKVPYGSAGIETMLSVVYTEGVRRGRITPARMVELLCTNPAKIFGLFPRKGTLRVGADADLVVFDPTAEWTVRAAELHGKTDYICFEGRKVHGRAVLTLLRGQPLLKDRRIVQKPGFGRFLRRTADGRAPAE
jgi:dihydropyrimidinase